ncbi:MAG: class II aldolase/adducin family protein [Anaerolineales bacterium]|nr:class II aldolase/adducin family protein [Anaerolineales bacterium]
MPEMQKAKETIISAAHRLLEKGFLSATGGNLSVRLPGEEAFAITPSNFDYSEMQIKDVCVLDFDLKHLEGGLKPSVESGMHAAIYQIRPDVHTIIHTHQVYPSTLASIRTGIPALFDEQVRFLGRSVDVIPYAPSGTGMLKKTIVKHIGTHHNAYLMASHGALVFGDSMQRAIHNVEILDKCALAYLLTLCTEKEAHTIPLIVREVAFAKLKKDQKKYSEGRH